MRNFTFVSTLVAMLFIATFSIKAQVAINTDGSSPDASSMLDVKSTTRGFLPPRMTTLQRTTLGSIAVAGLVVYDLTLKRFYYYDGTTWNDLSIGNLWTRSGTDTYLSNTGDNVGIGTTTPGYIAGATRYLTVSTPGSSPNQIAAFELKGASTTTYSPVNRIDFLSHSGALGVKNIARIESRITGSQAEGEMIFYTSNGSLSEQMRIDEDGQLGIGTSTPGLVTGASRYLTVSTAGNTNQIAAFELKGGSQVTFSPVNRIDFLSQSNVGNSNIARIESRITNSQLKGELLFYTNGGTLTEKMRIDEDGKVGIGTASPLGKLHVHDGASSNTRVFITPQTTGSGDSAAIFFAEDHDATYGMYWLYDGTGNQMELWGQGAGQFGPHMVVNRDNGNVAIGNTFATGYKLSVDGKIICTEVRVNLVADWPDYVFKRNYKLLPVEKLGSYIAEHGHLPNMPPAADIKKEGLDVGEMQRLMMEKIEELSLYVIEQQKQISELRDQLNEVRK